MKHKDIIAKICAYHPPVDESITCDGYKAGDPEDECTGVVTALAPTMDVIRKTIELGANLLIVHEPIFYMTPDFPEWKTDFRNTVADEKAKLIEEYHITIWRDHDRMHANVPDSIFSGVAWKLGWEEYQVQSSTPCTFVYHVPETTVQEMKDFLEDRFHMNGLRYIGDPAHKISKIAIVGHLCPGLFMEEKVDEKGHYHDYATAIIKEMEEGRIDAVIPGEIVEWNVLSYINDAVSLGKNRACFNVGHFNLEEPGMEYAAKWVRDLLPEDVKVHYVRVEDQYRY